MIDGINIKCFCKETVERVRQNDKLWLLDNVNIPTGDVAKKPSTAKFYSLQISITPSNVLTIKGSLHKFWNEYHQKLDKHNRGYNFDDFTLNECRQAIALLCKELELEPAKLSVCGFEFGVNVDVSFNPFRFCENILSYQNKRFSVMESNNTTLLEIGYRCKQHQFVVKAYDKSKQYYLKERNIFRFEIGVKRMQFLQKRELMIKTVEDLVDERNVMRLGEVLLEIFTSLMIDDYTVNLDKLTRKEEHVLQNCRIASIWKSFSDTKRYTHKKRFNQIIELHGTLNWKQQVAHLIEDKWKMLQKI